MNRRNYSPQQTNNKTEIDDKYSLKVEKDREMESGTEWHTAGSVGWNFVIRWERNQRVFGIQSDHSDGWTRTVSVCEWMYSMGTPSQSSVSQHFKPSTPPCPTLLLNLFWFYSNFGNSSFWGPLLRCIWIYVVLKESLL